MKEKLFCAASENTIELIKDFHRNKKNIFLVPRINISSEAAFAGYLINYYVNINRKLQHRKNYRTFFCNSTHEALSGVIKVARHSKKNRGSNKKIIILDIDETLVKPYSLLKNQNQESSIIPDAVIISCLDEFQRELENLDSYLVIFCCQNNLNSSFLSKSLYLCKQKKILSALAFPDFDVTHEPSIIQSLDVLPDLVIFGESLTHYQVPFGAFLISEDVHKPWSSLSGAFLHSSTYGGNHLALQSMIENLIKNSPLLKSDSKVDQIRNKIATNLQKRNMYYSRFCNPGIDVFCRAIKFNLSPIRSLGTQLVLNQRKKEVAVLDCVTGAGAVIRGHSHNDVITNVLMTHMPKHSYWEELQQKFMSLIPFTHFFPAVSGASAVDIGLNLALATIGKKKIIVFKGNYAGKTLCSLIGTSDENYRKHFGPLFQEIVYIDPLSKEAAATLYEAIATSEVGLIWFELLQGSTLHEIPAELISIINHNKPIYEYLIGIDEILTGIYRLGKLFSCQGVIDDPDIITASKGLCDGTFPFGITIVSDSLYKKVYEKNQPLVQYYQGLYTNQLGSHIALNCLNYFCQEAVVNQIQCVGNKLEMAFSKFPQISPYVEKVLGKGHIYIIKYKKSIWTFGSAGMLFFDLFMFKQGIDKEKIFLFFNRCIPSLIMTNEEAEILINKLENLLVRNRVLLYIRFHFFCLNTIVLLAVLKIRNVLYSLFDKLVVRS